MKNTDRPTIAFLSEDPSQYTAALYQHDFLESLRTRADVILIDSKERLDYIQATTAVDVYLFGHLWLDESGKPLFDFDFQSIANIRKVFFLNKEYSSLASKIEYAERLKPDLILTHHHDLQSLTSKSIEIPTEWVPFAANHMLFKPGPTSRPIAANFSGVLRNPSFPETQSDERELIHRMIFKTVNDFIVARRGPYKPFKIHWSVVSGSWAVDTWNRFQQGRSFQNAQTYSERLANSSGTINTLSPLGLVGTRFFETALSKSLILTTESSDLQGLFKESHIVRFGLTESSLVSTLEFAVGDSQEKKKITEAAYSHALEHHTWDIRARKLLQKLGYETE